jgi:hypothetical protein
LANLAMSGNKRASREEMQKVARVERDWLAEAGSLTDKDALRQLWAEAKAAGAHPSVLAKVAQVAEGLQTS